jgi:hypothetical protein
MPFVLALMPFVLTELMQTAHPFIHIVRTRGTTGLPELHQFFTWSILGGVSRCFVPQLTNSPALPPRTIKRRNSKRLGYLSCR